MERRWTFFSEDELTCRCGCRRCAMDEAFMLKLDRARRLAMVPFHVSSGFRCAKHNARVKGVKDSSHLRGIAVDISVCDSHSRFRILSALMAAGFHRLGIGQTLIHVDDDASKEESVVWLYADK